MQPTHAYCTWHLPTASTINISRIPPWLPLLVISIANCSESRSFPRTEPRDATLGRTGDPCVLLNVLTKVPCVVCHRQTGNRAVECGSCTCHRRQMVPLLLSTISSTEVFYHATQGTFNSYAVLVLSPAPSRHFRSNRLARCPHMAQSNEPPWAPQQNSKPTWV